MPTAELIQPQQADTSDAPLAEEDVEALLSQADALMNDLQANLGEQNADEAATTNEEAIHDMAEEISTSAESADADAIMSLLNPHSSEEGSEETASAASSADATVTADNAREVVALETTTPEPTPSSAGSPQSFSEDWFDHASTSDDQIPSIPDDHTSTAKAANISAGAEVAASKAAMPTKWFGRTVHLILRRLVRLPLDILILLDRPFAGMDPRTKSFIGYAAISTIVVAISTWIYGDLRHTS